MHQTRRTQPSAWAMFALLLACVGLYGGPAHGGLSQPGMVLVGAVSDDTGQLVTEGPLTVTFTPTGGGTAFTQTVKLSKTLGPAGVLSYALMIPFEMAAPGSPVSPAAVAVSSAPVAYTRLISLAGRPISRTDTVDISTATVGTIVRADLPKPMPSAGYHSGDTNQDHRMELLELLRMIELFTSTADHSYHCDALSGDGFDNGPGEQDCAPHSGDYDPQDWKISLPELLRMIELYAGTGDHQYHPDNSGPDGFNPGPAGSAKVEKRLPNLGALAMRRSMDATERDLLYVTIAFELANSAQVASMGLEEQIPAGWAFAGIAGGVAPAVLPRADASGLLEFSWLPTPLTGGSFTYLLMKTDNSVKKPAAICGEALYRVRGVRDTVRIPVACTEARAPEGRRSVLAQSKTGGAADGAAGGAASGAHKAASGGDEMASGGDGAESGGDKPAKLPLSQAPIFLVPALAVIAVLRIRRRVQ